MRRLTLATLLLLSGSAIAADDHRRCAVWSDPQTGREVWSPVIDAKAEPGAFGEYAIPGAVGILYPASSAECRENAPRRKESPGDGPGDQGDR